MRVCPGCGAENGDASIDCPTCGDRLDPPPSFEPVVETDRGASGFPPPTTAILPPPAAVPGTASAPPFGAPGPRPPQCPPSAPSLPGANLPESTLPSSESLVAAIEIAERSGRADLASGLRANREQVRSTEVTIAVVGEFKKGKSSLVNALINAELCPSDSVDATVVPIVIRHGDALAMTVEMIGQPPSPIDVTQVAQFGSESGNEANHLGVVGLEVAVPRQLLASGLVIIDTPGVGGLESAAGALSLALLEEVDGVLFVTDCTQELTRPELVFLSAARARCPNIVCVMTKVDLYRAAAVLADHNRRHLADAGLGDIDVLTASSVLHLLSLAQRDPQLEQESGFGPLVDAIHTTIWEPARARGLVDAGLRLAGLADHLAIPLEAARRATSSDQAAETTIARLTEARDRVRQYRSSTARWQKRLAGGIQDASVELDRDLQARLSDLARLVEARVDADDPADDLVFEAWVHKTVIEGVVAHYELIAERANALADEIGQQFATLDRQAALQVEVPVPSELLAAAHINRNQRLLKDGVARRLVTTGKSYSGGLVLFSSVVGVASSLPWIPLVALPFVGLVAKRSFGGDRDRQRSAHGQELVRLAATYLDEIGLIVRKDSGDTVRRIQREIHEHYAARAEQLDVTLQRAVVSAERARAGVDPSTLSTEADERATIRGVVGVAQRLVTGVAIP